MIGAIVMHWMFEEIYVVVVMGMPHCGNDDSVSGAGDGYVVG